jgi:hypothetical protein
MHLEPSKRHYRRGLTIATLFFLIDGIYVLTRGVYYRHGSARGLCASTSFSAPTSGTRMPTATTC